MKSMSKRDEYDYDDDSDVNDLKSTVIHLIISCSKDYTFKKSNLEIVSITRNEEIKIKRKIKKLVRINFFKGKNVYLLKIKLYFDEEEEEEVTNINFNIKLKYLGVSLITISSFNVKKYDQIFIYNEKYKYEQWHISRVEKVDDFVNQKYKLSNFQKFEIFHRYLQENQLTFLLIGTYEAINSSKKLDFEFVLTYFTTLINGKEIFSDLSGNSQYFFKSIFLNFGNKKKIIIKNYNNKFNGIMRIIKNFKIDITDKNFTLYFYLFLLIYYQFNSRKDNFNGIFEKIPLKYEAFDFIKNHRKCFPKLNYSNLQLILKYNCNREDFSFNDIISLSTDFNECIKFCCKSDEFIISQKPKIKIDDFPLPDENTDMELLEQFVIMVKIIKGDMGIVRLRILYLIDRLNNKNYKKLVLLKNIVEKHKQDIPLSNQIFEKLRPVFHYTGKYLIENNELNNLEIITFIQEDGLNYSSDYKDQPEYARLIKYIDFNKVDQQFYKRYVDDRFNYEVLFGKNNYYIFLESLIQCAKKYEHLYLLYHILPFQSNSDIVHFVIIKLIEVLSDNRLERNQLSIMDISKIIQPLFKLIYRNHYVCLGELIEAIKNNFSGKEVDELFIIMLKREKFDVYMINVIINNIKLISNIDVVEYLKIFYDNISIQISFLEKLNERVLNEDEVISRELSDNLVLLKELVIMNFFDVNTFDNVYYIKKTRENSKLFINKLHNFDFSIHKLEIMDQLRYSQITERETSLHYRIKIISLGNENITNNIYYRLIEKIKNCKDIFKKIEEIIQTFSYYFPEEYKEIIQYYCRVRERILELLVKQFPEPAQLKQFDELYREAHQITKFKTSRFFIEIYRILKFRNEEVDDSIFNRMMEAGGDLFNHKYGDRIIFKQAKEKFENLKCMFLYINGNLIDLELLEEVLINMNDEEIIKEIYILKDIFEIKDSYISVDHLFERLKLLSHKEERIDVLNKILLLLRDFHIKNGTIQIQLNNFIKLLKDKPTLDGISYVDTQLKQLNLSILNTEANNAIAVIDSMYRKSELMKFILNKRIEDIRQMSEFIDDTENVFIILSDIDQLESCMSFIQVLNKEDKQDEKKFLDTFIELINKPMYRDIGIKFENSSGKYNDFYELYTYHLDSNELNKAHIKSIYFNSVFELKYVNPQYQCSVFYYNNKKLIKNGFDEMLDFRDIALLRKKDQNTKHEKERSYINICNIFIQIISNIQEIIDLLNGICCKGYFRELNYTISVTNGKAVGYIQNTNSLSMASSTSLINSQQHNDSNEKNQTLDEIITELKSIIKSQDSEVKFIYNSSPLVRMLYGKQFSYLYNTIIDVSNLKTLQMSRVLMNRKLLNLIKYITNNTYKKHGIIGRIINNSPLKQMFEDISLYLDSLFILNSLDLRNVYRKAFLLDISRNGFYSYSCSKDSIEINTIYCSIDLTGNYPIAQTVLYCNKLTSEEEIISFLYRCLYCEDSILFIIIKPDYLCAERKNMLIELIKELYNEKLMKSCLLFIYSEENKSKEIITEIVKLPNHKYFDFKAEGNINDNHIYHIPNVEIYSSEVSGLGKSTLIKNKFREEDQEYEYVYFPIGGDIQKDEIIQRLIELTDKKVALHIDLYDTRYLELLSEFLFSFLILKYYSQDENIFYYGDEIKIKVEIPNSFIDFKTVFPIFIFFENVYIELQHLPSLIVPANVTSDIQIVANYLKNINNINASNIYIPGVSVSKTSNIIKAQILSQRECSDLVYKFLEIHNPNYYQIESYISIIAEQLRLFTNSIYLNSDYINDIKQVNLELGDIRSFFVKSLTLITKHFVTSAYDNIIKGQNIAHSQQQKKDFDIERENEQAIEVLTQKEPFSLKNIKHSMILINEDGQSISEIVTCDRNSKEYRQLKAIYNLGESGDILEYQNLKPEQFLVQVKKVLNLFNPINEHDNDSPNELNGKILTPLNQIVKSYIFTADNFIKLILISLRLRTNIPVIMMGETGCGKTSLIRIISELKGITMYTLNTHAGIEDIDIIQFIDNNNLLEGQLDGDNNNSTIWVFLDEINTCNSLGLITEIMLKRSCRGKKIKNNVKFIAACNPYRLDTRKREVIGLYDESKHMIRKLVYTVHPLPHSLLNFVFDFGTPENKDIERYISNMVYQILTNNIMDKNILSKIQRIAEKVIFNAHIYIKNNFEISSVSLREIRRWGILFEWFSQLLRNPYFSEKFNFTEENIYIYSLNLSVYLCYYIRIYEKDKRQGFLDLMKTAFNNDFDFKIFPEYLQNIIATAVELENGIAKNRALLENLFCIFVCLNAKIPLFIIGKPGCSKSLSAQLIFKSMNGKDSSNDFFKHFPKVFTNSYQGSLNSSSKGVLKIFEKTRNSLKDKQFSREIISTVYFDEMGLAEISQNNPLKVIHSQLEYDDNQDKISFIGISNWPLDASKMNRGIHLSIPEPDKEDLIETARTIAESFDARLNQKYNEYYKYLAQTYYDYKQELQVNFKEFQPDIDYNISSDVKSNNNYFHIKEFHGTRDFYHLIKTVSRQFIKEDFPVNSQKIKNILEKCIESNFGGLDHSIRIFKKLLKKYVTGINDIKEYNIMECIKTNILNYNRRYLLIETKSSISHFLVSLILDQMKKNYVFYYGSQFEDDISQGYYSSKLLNKIQVTMSQDNVMILKNLTGLYPSLYDLFNQNFRKVGDSNYARIALGNSNTQNYFVHEHFRCIVLLDKNEINKQDPPFINRFEKHIVTFEYLLNEKQIKISNEISETITSLIKIKNKPLKVNLQNELINCNLEEIQGMVYQLSIREAYKNQPLNNINNEWMLKFIRSNVTNNASFHEQILGKIIPTFSQDIMFYAKNSNFAHQYEEDFQNILDIYLKNQHKNIKSFMEKLDSYKYIVYTYSNILDSIFDDDNYVVENGNISFSKEKTKNIFINQYSSERAVEKTISDYYMNSNYNLCIIHYDLFDYVHLCHVNYLIENIENTLKENGTFKSKIIICIIHLKRPIHHNNRNNQNDNENIQNEYLISHLTEWRQVFIDNLNGIDIDFKEVYEASTKDLFNNKKLINLDEEFKKDLYHAFTLISYNVKINFSSIEKEDYIKTVCNYIFSNEQLIYTIQNLVRKKIENIKENIIMTIFTEYNFEDNDVDFISVIIKNLKSIYNVGLIRTLVQLEKYNILSTKLLNKNDDQNDLFEEIYNEYINTFDSIFGRFMSSSQIVKVDLILGISYPCIISLFNKINVYTNTLIEDYLENENILRREGSEEMIQNYIDKRIFLENNLIVEFTKKSYIEKILENSKNIDKSFFKDYIIYYLSKSNKKFLNKKILNIFYGIFDLFISRDNHPVEPGNKNLVKFFLFIESYKDYILPLCEFVCSIDLYINIFLEDFISSIKEKSFRYKNEDNRNIIYVNEIFFNLYESVVKGILNIKFKELSDESFEYILNEITIFSNCLNKINVELNLSLKQFLYLKDFIQVKEYFTKNIIPLRDNLYEYMELLKKENEIYVLLHNTNVENKEEPIEKEFSFLENKLSSYKNYSLLIVKLINNKMKISSDEEYILKLLKIICSNNIFIIKSKIIFENIFSKFNISPVVNRIKDNIQNDLNDFEKYGVKFIKELKKANDNIILKYINEIDNKCVDEVLLSLFDGKISKYIEKSKDDITFQSLHIFKSCVDFIAIERAKINKNNRLGILYCISYIKLYCYRICKIIYSDKKSLILEQEKFKEYLKLKIPLNNQISSIKKIIKIYILKLLNLVFIGNYKKFLEFIESESLFREDFDFSEKVPNFLNYLFIQNDTYDDYKNLRFAYLNSKRENFINKSDFVEHIRQNNEKTNVKNVIIFYDLLINEEISNYYNKYDDDNGKKLEKFILNIKNELDLSKLSMDILTIFYTKDFLTNHLLAIKKRQSSEYEMFLYSHKFAFICSLSKPNSFYSKLISRTFKNFINNTYIPGGEPNDNLIIKSCDQIVEFVKSTQRRDGTGAYGIYMCSCKLWYTVGGCGKPMMKFKCRNCGKDIGGIDHNPVLRDGHVKIYLDQQHIANDRGFAGRIVNYRMFDDLKEEAERERNKQIKGFKKVKKEFFKSSDKKVRKMNNITYRILCFIFYSCILCNKQLGYLAENDINDFYYSDVNKSESILSILIDIWKLLVEDLLKGGIENIQCFINEILPKLTDIIVNNDKRMENANEREEFEQRVNEIVETAIKKETYEESYNIYIRNNKDILELEDDSIKSILQETSNLNNLPEDSYPLMKYFYAANYPDYVKFYNQFTALDNSQERYPVIANYLNSLQNEESIRSLQNFNLINPFVIYMLNKYNNKISRKEAEEIIIYDELVNDSEMEKLFKDFRKGWENIYKNLSNYDCHGRLKEKNITENDCIAYCLNDNLVDDYGKYIATAYKDFITYQNTFLRPLIDNNSSNEYLYPYSSQLQKAIVIQRANRREIVTLDIKNDMFDSFDDLIYTFSYRDCFQKNGNVNYFNYKENKFDFYSIEVELSKILLPEKRLFLNEQHQDFVTYAFEEFNQNESLILDYKEKIKNVKLLTKEEKALLNRLLQRKDYNLFLFNLQSLFLYFINEKNIDGNESLGEEIKQLPENIINLDDEFLNIFKGHVFNIKLNKLIDCYEFIEYINFKNILNNVSSNAHVNLEKSQITELENHFEKDNLLISRNELRQAVRKFISRFLISDKLKNYDWNIFLLLRYKTELWSDEVVSEDNESRFDDEIEQLENINIRIEQSIDFYDKLEDKRGDNKKKKYFNNIKVVKDKGKKRME